MYHLSKYLHCTKDTRFSSLCNLQARTKVGTEDLVRELQDICSSDPSRAAGTIAAYMQMAQAHGECLTPAEAYMAPCGGCFSVYGCNAPSSCCMYR